MVCGLLAPMRAFVAVELPEAVREALSREQARLQAASGRQRDLRWTRTEGLHLTLKFLGEVAPECVPEVTAALGALGRFERFEAAVKGFGFFPDARRPRVLWAGVEAPPALGELARRVETALEKAGFARESRAFQPHLTLARFRAPRTDRALEAAIEAADRGSLGRFEVSEFFLFESRLLAAGAEHHKVARFPQGKT